MIFLDTQILTLVECTTKWKSLSKILLNILLNCYMAFCRPNIQLSKKTISNLLPFSIIIVASLSLITYLTEVDLVECLTEGSKLIFTESSGGGFHIELILLLFLEFFTCNKILDKNSGSNIIVSHVIKHSNSSINNKSWSSILINKDHIIFICPILVLYLLKVHFLELLN